jgi:DNA-directed RNA polymerase
MFTQSSHSQKIDVRKQVDGIVAHLVHSMDATHMMQTTNRLYAEGIRHFAMVHDSYGVHACDVDLLNRVLREEFIRIYSEPVLQNFIDQQRKARPRDRAAGSSPNRRPRYSAGPLVSLLFCLIGKAGNTR